MRRIQRKRERGWRKPAGAVYIGRPSVYGNPFDWREIGCTPAAAVALHKLWLLETHEGQRLLEAARRELSGHDVMCWCPLDEPCHGDTYIDLLEGGSG